MIRITQGLLFFVGLLIFGFGIAITIKVQHLGIHPWDVLNVALFETFGLTIGTWNVIFGFLLVTISLFIDRSYINIGTFLNAVLVGTFVDFFLWIDILPSATKSWLDFIIISWGIITMGIGGGMYNAAGIGSGPRDGLMLSLSDKIGLSISKVRIIVETAVLIVGFLLGGPVFVVTFIFTFIQSPIFQQSYKFFGQLLALIRKKVETVPVLSERDHSI